MTTNPKFIVIEGGDGTGKSTQVARLAERLQNEGHDVITTRCPGATPVGERIRDLLLSSDEPMDPMTEAALHFAANNQLVQQVVMPAIKAGKVVITDRYVQSTWAYQVAGQRMPSTVFLQLMEAFAKNNGHYHVPTHTIILDAPVQVTMARLGGTNRYECQNEAFFERVRNGYRNIPTRWLKTDIVDANQPVDAVANDIYRRLCPSLR